MPKLSNEVKVFIVTHLAMFDTPTQVALAVKEEFGVEVTRQAVQYYDPTVGEKPPKTFIALFETTRTRFIDSASEIPIAIRAVRLRRLDRMARALEDRRNVLGAAQLMKQAAEDIGGVYTNRRELTGKDGKDLMPELTDEERRERVVGIMREAVKRRDLAKVDRGDVVGDAVKRAAKKPTPKEKAKA